MEWKRIKRRAVKCIQSTSVLHVFRPRVIQIIPIRAGVVVEIPYHRQSNWGNLLTNS